MNPKMLICFLAALVVSSSAIPKSRESNEDIAEIVNQLEVDDADEALRNQKELGDIYGDSGAHNLTLGYRTSRDRFLMTRYINKPAKFMGVVERDFFAVSRYGEHISFIQAIDLHQNANEAGFASIIYGGIGDRYVIIRIKSARGYSLKYNLQVLGQK